MNAPLLKVKIEVIMNNLTCFTILILCGWQRRGAWFCDFEILLAIYTIRFTHMALCRRSRKGRRNEKLKKNLKLIIDWWGEVQSNVKTHGLEKTEWDWQKKKRLTKKRRRRSARVIDSQNLSRKRICQKGGDGLNYCFYKAHTKCSL